MGGADRHGVMTRIEDDFPSLRNSLNGSYYAAVVDVSYGHFKANMDFTLDGMLIEVPFFLLCDTQRHNHDTFCARHTNRLAHCRRFRLFQNCSDSFHTILLLWMERIL